MKVLVNGTTLNVTNAYAERNTVSGIITCTVIVPQSEMDYSDLKALFKGNTEDIISTKDDGSTELFSGFTFASILDDDANAQCIVNLTSDEYSFQLGRNRQLEADKASLEGTVAYKDSEITALNGVISEKDKTITARDNTISEKETVITEQAATIAELKQTIEELGQGSAGGENNVSLDDIAAAIEEGVNEV